MFSIIECTIQLINFKCPLEEKGNTVILPNTMVLPNLFALKQYRSLPSCCPQHLLFNMSSFSLWTQHYYEQHHYEHIIHEAASAMCPPPHQWFAVSLSKFVCELREWPTNARLPQSTQNNVDDNQCSDHIKFVLNILGKKQNNRSSIPLVSPLGNALVTFPKCSCFFFLNSNNN